jgi:N4-gp56 family major capsid protein
MAIQGYSGTALDLATVQSFVPEVWAGEVRRFRDQKFMMTNGVKKIPFEGKKGDTIHIPNISRAAVYDKMPQTPVTLQARNDGEFIFQVTRYRESSYMIEDIVNIQSQYNLRSEYTREAGYAMARDMDNFILAHRAVINSYDSQRLVSYNNGTADLVGDGTANAHWAGTPAPLTYAAILLAKQKLDEADIPSEGRVLYVSPAQYLDLLSINFFISVDFNGGGSPVSSGKVGSILDFTVEMSTQFGVNSNLGYRNGRDGVLLPTPGVLGSPYLPDQHGTVNGRTLTGAADLDAQANSGYLGLPVLSGAGATAADAGQTLGLFGGVNQWATAIACHPEWVCCGVQQSVKTESSRETLYLSDAFVTSQVYGSKVWRPDNAVVIHTSGI